jgi:pimeloyl-ACP methyl ester carboxylesterase
MGFMDTFLATHKPKTVWVGEMERQYIVGGSGRTAFLIFPGSGQDALSCYDMVDAFEKDFRAIAVNYDGIYSVDAFFDYVNAILKQENIDRVILYGLSLGGFLAQHYVRRYKDKISHLILSHSGSTKSKTIIWHVAVPGKIVYKVVRFIPQRVLNAFFMPVAGRVQAGKSDILKLYEKYSTKENLQRRIDFAAKTTFSMIDKKYLKTVYTIGTEMERLEKSFTSSDLRDWKGKILIIRTDNDPLAQDDGMFKKYYPDAKVKTYHETGHLTPFIQFENMVEKIRSFLQT